MKVWYDCEFLEDGRTIDLISLGMLRADGKEYYAINAGVTWLNVWRHEWLRENVIPHLPTREGTIMGQPYRALDRTHPDVKPHDQIRDEVTLFLLEAAALSGPTDELELWSWYGAYDHVALCQLWGPMISKPGFVPMYTNDIRQEFQRYGNPRVEIGKGTHNALDDARYHKALYDFIKAHEQQMHDEEIAHILGG